MGIAANVLFEPGLFTSQPVRVAVVAGSLVSIVSAVVGATWGPRVVQALISWA
jgi:hypothetical protein